MRALKILVIVMGVMIVVGVAVLVSVIIGRVSGAASTARPFVGAPIDLPPGARIEGMTADANRLVLRLALPDGASELVVIDLATGARLGTIPLRAPP